MSQTLFPAVSYFATNILEDEPETGVTIMKMDAGLDTGPMIDVARVPISARDTSATLLRTLTALGAELVVRVLRRLEHDGVLASTPQPLEGATYASKIARADAMIDWNDDARTIDRQVRAFDPAPGAYTCLRGETWKVWSPQPLPEAASASPGTVIDMRDAGIDIACGSGVLRIGELQPAGGKRVSASAVLHGRRLGRGDAFTPCV